MRQIINCNMPSIYCDVLTAMQLRVSLIHVGYVPFHVKSTSKRRLLESSDHVIKYIS